MSSRKHLVMSLIAAVIVTVAGFGLLVWPSLAQATQVAADIEELNHKNRTLEERTLLVKELNAELEAARAHAARTLKRIPTSPDPAELLQQLSMPVDGYYVADQTITASPSRQAALDETITARAMPLTVDLVARYDAVQEIISRAETTDRLVRVASIRVRRHPEKSNIARDDEALLLASITLEAIFDPSSSGSSRP
jgi:Tfp pilus assembly protein PilO